MKREGFIPCLSVQQPWAWALFHGKPVENRTWKTDFRGDLLIHASKTFDDEGYDWIVKNREKLGIVEEIPKPKDFPLGCIIGKVNQTCCTPQYLSPWFFGPYGHIYKDQIEFKNPIPFKGKLKFFDVPVALVKE